MHLSNYSYLLYIERVLHTRQIFKLNLPRLKIISRVAKSYYSESLDSQLNLLWLISYLAALWKWQPMIRTSYSTYEHLCLESLDFGIESVMIDIVFSSIVKITTNDSHIILHLWTLVLKLIWYSNIALYLFSDIFTEKNCRQHVKKTKHNEK